jgi:GDP-L-fucose synthase
MNPGSEIQKNQKQIEIWGDGSAVRQFLHHKDLGEAVKKILMSNINNPILNVAPVDSISIFELVKLLSNIFEFTGDVIYDIIYCFHVL